MNAVTSTTAAKMKALREAKKLGCSGAHQTSDGVWRPCSSAESLAKIVPSSPMGIGTNSAPRRQQRGNNNMQRQWENLGSRGIVAIDTLSGGGLVSGVVGKQYQPAAPRDEDPDVFTDIEAARDRSRQLGCIGVSRRISRSGRTIWMPCTNMTDLANRTGRTALGRRNMQKRTERFIADVVKRNQPKAIRSRKKSLYDDLHGNSEINTKGLGPKVGKRIGRGLRAAPGGFVFIDVTGAIDADKDGIVFEGLPLERPIIPRFIIPEGTARRVQNLIGTTALANEQNRRSGLSPDGAIDKNVLSQIIGVTPNDIPTEREDTLLSKLRNVLGSGRKPSTYTQSAVMEDRRLDFGDPDLEISRSSERIGKRETAGLMKALDAVDDEYEFLSASELEELVTRLVPGSNEELMEALKSSPYTRKNAKRIYERITAAEPDYEATLLARKILQDELMRTPGVRNAIRQYGIPPIVVTGYEPDIDNMGFIDLTSGPRMWQSIIGGYAPSGFIAFNSGVFPDPRTGRVRDAMFKGEDLDSLIRHELAHAWQFMAAKQGGPARDYLVSLYSELHENLQQGRGNPASKNYSEALYRSVTWGSEQERASARKISEYAETARIEWFAESFAAITDDDPSRRMRVDNTSIANMANVLGMSVNEFMGFIGEQNRPQLSERARSSSTRSVSNLLLGPMSKPEKEAHDWLLENPSYVADSPDAMLLRLPPDTVDAFIRNQRLSTRSRYNTDVSKAQAKAEEARRNGELGQKVLDSLFARATGENSSSRPTMWFVGGTTGSGKSTLRTNGVLSGVPDADTAVDIDPDVIKTMHPDWDGGRGASAVHGWSTQWALYGMRQATAQNRDYVVTGTGVRVDQMLIGRNNGYKVVGHYVHVPTPIAEQRMASRAQQGGVKLPTNFASQYASELQYKVRKAITNGYMDEFFLWDNSQDEGNATLAVIRREDGTFDILNRRVFEEFFGKDGARAVEKHWESQRAEATTGSILPSTRSSSSGAGSFTNRNWPERFSIQKPQTIYRKNLTGKRTSNSELFGVTFGSDVDLSDHRWMSAQLVNVKAENLKTSQPVVFRNSTLKAVSFKNTIIPPGSDMHRAILERVSFDGSEIIGVDFSETSMRGVDFSKSRVGNINLTGAILERVEFDIADLSDSGLTTEQLRGSGIIWTDRTKFSPEIQQFIDSLPKDQIVNQNGKYSFVVNNTSTTPMSKADLEYAKSLRFILGSRVIDIPAFTSDDKTISGLDGTRGTISNPGWASLRDGKITKSYMDLFSAINQNIADVKITDSLMSGSRFTGSNLQDVSFSGSLLRGASFRGVKIRGTLDLRRTDLQGADFAGAKFDTEALRNSNIDLRGANLTDAYLGELPLGKLKLDHAILSGAQWNGPDSQIPKDLRERGLRGTRSMSRSTSHGAAMQLNDLSERLASPTRLSRREKTELIQDMSSMYRELIDSRLERPERQEFADFIESLKDTAFKDLERFRVPSIPNRPMLLIESARANDKKSFVERFKKVRETEPNFMRSRSAIQAWEEANSIARKSDELDALHIQAIDDLREERVIAQSLPQLQNILHGDFLDTNNRKRPTGNFPSGKRAKENIIAGTESTRSRRIDANRPLPISEISPNLSDDFPRVTGHDLGGFSYDLYNRRFNSSLAQALRRAIRRIAGNGNGRRSDELRATKKTTKRIIADVLKDDLSKLLDGTHSRKPVREALTDDRDRLLDSLRIIFDTREEASAVNLPTMHAEPYEPFKSMVDPEVDWSSIYIPTQQDALDMFEEISALRIGSRPEYDEGYVPRHSEILERHSRRFIVNDEPLISEEELSDPSNDETFIGIYEMGMRAPYLFGNGHDGMHLAVGRGFDRHGEYAASLAEISYILQIPDMSDEDKNLVASALIEDVSRHFQYNDVLIDVLPNYDTDMYDMRKVFDVMIRRSTYRDVGGNESNNSTRSMRSATDADVDAITQEYLNSERFPRRLSEAYGIDVPLSPQSTRSALFKTYKNRPMTEEEKQRFQPLNLADGEKTKIESGVKLIFANEYDEIQSTLIVGPQVARFRGTPGTKMYIDPNPPEQDFIDEKMTEWERAFGPPSDPRRRTSSNQSGGGGRRSSDSQRQSGNDDEDALDRINRLVDEDRARRGAQSTRSRTDTYQLTEQTIDDIISKLELNESEAEIAKSILAGSPVPRNWRDRYDAEQRNHRIYIKQIINDLKPDASIGETGKEIAESLSIRVSSNGIPVITSQPHPFFNSIIPDRRDWTYVEAPSADAIRKLIEQAQEFEDDWDPGIGEAIDVLMDALYKIVSNKLDEVGAEPEVSSTKTFNDFPQYLIDSLKNPRRAINNLVGTDGIHDAIGHLGTGRGFDRHGEWANALAMVSVITNHPDIGLDARMRDRVARWWLDTYGISQLMSQLRTDAGEDLKKITSVNQLYDSRALHKAIYGWPGTVQDLIDSLTTEPTGSLRSTRSSRFTNTPNGISNLAYLEQDVRRSQFMGNISPTRAGQSTGGMQRRQNPVTASNATRSIVSRRSTRSLSSTVPQLRISEDGSRAYMDASAKDAFLANPQAFIDSLTEADIPNGYFRKGERNKLDKYKQDLLALATLDSLVPNEDGYGVSARHLFAVDALDSSKANPPDIVRGDRRRNILATRRTEKIFHQADVASLKAGEALFVTDIPATGKMSAIDNGLMVRNTDGSLTLIEIDDEDELDAIEEFMDGANQRLNENGVAILSVDDIRASLASTKKVSSILQTLENYHTTIADIDPRIPRPNIIFKADYVLSKYPGIDSKRVAGTAYPDANSIVMWKTSDDLPYVDIMLHEFGHIADFALGFRVAVDDRDVSYSSDYSFSSLTDDWVPAMESDQAHGLLLGARNMSLRVIAGTTSFDVEADRGAARQPTSVPGTNYRRIALAVDESHGPRIGNRFITRYAKESDRYPEDFAESTSLFLRDKMFGYATSVTDTNGEQRTYTFAELYPNRAAVLEKLFYPSTRSVSNFDSRFASTYGAQPIFGDGDCYEAASNMADRLRSPEFGYSDNQIRIVHGIPLGTGGEAMGVRYGHAWAEVAKGGWEKYEQLRNEIADVLREAETITSKSLKEGLARRHNKLMQELIRMEAEDMIVYDFSNGNEHVFPRYLYYKIGNIEDENTRYYSRQDADIKMVADEHYGPWE